MTLTSYGKIGMARNDVKRAMADLAFLRDLFRHARTAASINAIAERIKKLEDVIPRALAVPGVAERIVEESEGVTDALTRFADDNGTLFVELGAKQA